MHVAQYVCMCVRFKGQIPELIVKTQISLYGFRDKGDRLLYNKNF